MPSLTLDLEAIHDPEMPPYIPREGSDTFPPPPYWQIVTIGVLWADDAICTKRIGVLEGDEPAMPEKLVGIVRKARPDIVTFNGRKFDMPVITARCMRHGIAFPERFARDVNYRFTDAGHFDVADFLTDYGAGRQASLDAWAKMIGMPGKLDCSGADVAQMMADGRLRDVQAYCMADVAQTHAVRLRLELVRGMTSDRYRVAMQSLIDAIHIEPKMSVLWYAMNSVRVSSESTTETASSLSRLMHVHGEACV